MLGVGILVFFIVRLIPGDAVDALLRDTARIDPALAGRMRYAPFSKFCFSTLKGKVVALRALMSRVLPT